MLLKEATRVFVAGFQDGDTSRGLDFPVEGGYLWDTTSDTQLDLSEGTVVNIEQTKKWFGNTAGLNTILARVTPTGS